MTQCAASEIAIDRLKAADEQAFRELLAVFAEAFEEPETYLEKQPSSAYLRDLLAGPDCIALAARADGRVVAGLTAYVWRKFEQERKEVYVYDLAVAEAYRRRGIATALLLEMKRVAAALGAYLIVIQTEADNAEARAVYSRLGRSEEALSFDIDVP